MALWRGLPPWTSITYNPGASFFPITGPVNCSDFISKSLWTNLIHEEVLRQCDVLDGVIDGVIEDPNVCNFRPEALLCKPGVSDDCLSSNQVNIVRKVFSPLIGQNGSLIYPAMQPGIKFMAAEKLYAGMPFSYSEVRHLANEASVSLILLSLQEWFKYVVYDPSWNAAHFDIQDTAKAETLNPSNIRTWPASLSNFRDRGGKMIMYHGGQDNQITSFNTERFYKFLRQGMEASSNDLDAFLRFFRVPGIFHCNSGPGGWVIGQGGGTSAAGIPFASGNNVLAALVQWVENGTAVQDIVGTKFVNDTVKLGVDFRHRHCK